MVIEGTIKIFKIKHNDLREPYLVIANDINDAIEKFLIFHNDGEKYYYSDVKPDGIESVTLDNSLRVLMEDGK